MSDSLSADLRKHLELTLSMMTQIRPGVVAITKLIRRRYIHVIANEAYNEYASAYASISKCLSHGSLSKCFNNIQETKASIFLMYENLLSIFDDVDINKSLEKIYRDQNRLACERTKIHDLKRKLPALVAAVANAEYKCIPRLFSHNQKEKRASALNNLHGALVSFKNIIQKNHNKQYLCALNSELNDIFIALFSDLRALSSDQFDIRQILLGYSGLTLDQKISTIPDSLVALVQTNYDIEQASNLVKTWNKQIQNKYQAKWQFVKSFWP